jgi:Arylsulfotransferase (ASST)
MTYIGRLACSCAAVTALAFCTASADAITISPQPGTPSALPGTQISFLGAKAGSLSGISVVGSASGRHAGRLRSYSAATGASFVPSKPFRPGERVRVRASLHAGSHTRSLSTVFTIARTVVPPSGGFPIVTGTPADVQNFHSEAALHPPRVTVHQPAGSSNAPGYVFVAPFLGPGQWGPMIFDNDGNLVWFRPVAAGEDAADFQTQTFRGSTALTWWQGRTLILGYGQGVGVVADSTYKTIATVRAGNGYQMDEHEFTLLPNGAALIIGYQPVAQDLSSVGGPASGAAAVDCVIQEVDVHTGLVMWEWHALGHVPLTDSYSKPPATAGGYFDYFHLNSVQLVGNDSFVVSARNTWAVYDVNGHSGKIAWQLGGKRSSFALAPGVAFAYQHNAQLAPGGQQLTLFDDEGAPPVKPPSRGETIKLDLKAKTATLVSQLVRTIGPLSTGSQGNVQLLPGGGSMVGWGGLPNLTEFNAQGQVVYDAQLPTGEDSYRAYREPWSAQPATPPALTVTGGSAYASWNGATAVASWELLAGPSASALSSVTRVPRSGFETAMALPPSRQLPGEQYQVQALSASGRVLASSAVVPASG